VVDCAEKNPSNLSVIAVAWSNADTGAGVMAGQADLNPGTGARVKCPAVDDPALNTAASKLLADYISKNSEINIDLSSAEVSLADVRSNSKGSYYLALEKSPGQPADIVGVISCDESNPTNIALLGYSWSSAATSGTSGR
jgi:hypothetical protein